MNRASAARLAWSAWGLAMALTTAGLALVVLSRDAPVQALIAFRGFDSVFAITFASVGAPLAARRPSNPIGWLFLAEGVVSGFAVPGHAYGVYAIVTHGGTLPGGEVLAWAQELGATSIGYAVILSLLLFPDGRLPSRRWRPVVVLAVASALLETLGVAFAPGPVRSFSTVDNPFGVTGAAAGALRAMVEVGGVLFVVTIVAAIASLVFRYRNSRPTQRQQLKWIAFASTLVALGAVAFVLTGSEGGSGPLARASQIFLTCALASVPVAVGLAILRYRLFDIDRLISRTATYAIVTGVLLGTYALVALVPTAVAGSGDAPDAVIAAATLTVAALFRPVRRHVQDAVDRRFNRSRYDMEHLVGSFATRLRDEVDLEALSDELERLVAKAMQPRTVSLWVRDPPRA